MSRLPSYRHLLDNMDRCCLNTCRTEMDRIRINSGRVKAVHTENCHIDVFVTAWIYSIGIAFSVSRQPRPTSVHEIQPPRCRRKCRHEDFLTDLSVRQAFGFPFSITALL